MAEQNPSTSSGPSAPSPDSGSSDAPESSEPIVTPPPAPSTGLGLPAGSGSSGLEPNIAAGLACIFSIIGGVIFLLLEKKSAFVRFYAMQSVFLGGLCICLWFVFMVFLTIFMHIPLLGWLVALLGTFLYAVVGLGFFVVYVVTIIKAFSGVEWEIPFLGQLARKQLKTSPI